MSALGVSILAWLQSPVNIVLLITYIHAVLQSVAAQTEWRWAQIVSNILASLPGLNLPGLLSAGEKKKPATL